MTHGPISAALELSTFYTSSPASPFLKCSTNPGQQKSWPGPIYSCASYIHIAALQGIIVECLAAQPCAAELQMNWIQISNLIICRLAAATWALLET